MDMNPTVLTFLSILIMLLSVTYWFVYTKKRKNNTHKDIGYKLVFLITFCILAIPIIFSTII